MFDSKVNLRTNSYFQKVDSEIVYLNNFLENDILCLTCIRYIFYYYHELLEENISKKIIDFAILIYKSNFNEQIPSRILNQIKTFSIGIIDYIGNLIVKIENLKIWTDSYEKSGRILKRWPLMIFFISGVMCLLLSSIFHLFHDYSVQVKKVLNRMDYGGIAILIMGSCYPPYYYLFYCQVGN